MSEIVCGALRGARINIDMDDFAEEVFPVFRRDRGKTAATEDYR